MKTMTLMLVLLLSLVGACGKSDGDTAEKVFADMTANMQELSTILTGVTDEASAKAAVPKIDAVRAKMVMLATPQGSTTPALPPIGGGSGMREADKGGDPKDALWRAALQEAQHDEAKARKIYLARRKAQAQD